MKPPEGLAGLAAREAGHPAPITGELERLRAEVSLLQQEARIRQAINDGLRAEVDAEHAAVVSWLRQLAESCDTEAGTRSLLEAAGDIERGEHREETP